MPDYRLLRARPRPQIWRESVEGGIRTGGGADDENAPHVLKMNKGKEYTTHDMGDHEWSNMRVQIKSTAGQAACPGHICLGDAGGEQEQGRKGTKY